MAKKKKQTTESLPPGVHVLERTDDWVSYIRLGKDPYTNAEQWKYGEVQRSPFASERQSPGRLGGRWDNPSQSQPQPFFYMERLLGTLGGPAYVLNTGDTYNSFELDISNEQADRFLEKLNKSRASQVEIEVDIRALDPLLSDVLLKNCKCIITKKEKKEDYKYDLIMNEEKSDDE